MSQASLHADPPRVPNGRIQYLAAPVRLMRGVSEYQIQIELYRKLNHSPSNDYKNGIVTDKSNFEHIVVFRHFPQDESIR